MLPPLVPQPVIRALSFIETLNQSGYTPSEFELRKFLETRQPEDALSATMMPWATLSNISSAHALPRYLQDSGLAFLTAGRYALTPVGQAIVDAERGEQVRPGGVLTDAPLEVVGRLDEPFTYALILSAIDKVDQALVVDPYMGSRELFSLARLPRLTRVLSKETGIKGEKKDDRTRQFAIAAGARDDLGIRFVPPGNKELHDRLVIPSTGEALHLGSSLGGSQLTVMTLLSTATTDLLRDHYNELWDQAEAVEPIARAEVEEEDK